MSAITVQGVSKQFGTQIVLREVHFDLHAGRTVGLVGANGSGKTTLFRIITGEIEPDLGAVIRSSRLSVGHLRQEPQVREDRTLHEEVGSVFDDLLALEARVQAVSEQMAATLAPDWLAELMDQYDRLQSEFIAAGGHTFEARIHEILGGLGFREEDHGLRMSALSGGQKCRAALAKLLLTDRQMLLLDEPTNHLDIDAVRWLEKFLAGHHGGAVIISHDRYLLDRLCDQIIEIDRTRVSTFPGNYSNYVKTRETRTLTQQRQHQKDREFIEKERAFIAKHLAGQRTKEAQGRRTRLERRLKAGEFVLDAPTDRRTTNIDFKAGATYNGEVLRCDGLSKSYGDKALFRGLTFQVQGGQRFGITGPNGTGKSTLLKLILGEVQPDDGEVRVEPGFSVGYYAQESTTSLNPNRTVLEEMLAEHDGFSEQEMRSRLAQFLFTGDEVFKRLGTLSGGEQSRVRLAKLMMRSPDILILDEPTNHLDIPSREALESALGRYGGTIITVSHDRYFLDQLVDRLLVIRQDGAELYLGNYSDYIGQYEASRAEQQAAKLARQKQRREKVREQHRREHSPYDHLDLSEIEEMIMSREAALSDCNERFGDPAVYQDPAKLGELKQRMAANKAELEDLNAAWEKRVDQA